MYNSESGRLSFVQYLMTVFSSVSAFIGPLVGGVLYETIGFPWTATVFGFMILSAVSNSSMDVIVSLFDFIVQQ